MPLEQRMSLLRDAAHYLNSFGITSVVELTGDTPELEAFAALRDRGELTVRTRTGFGKVAVNHHPTPEFFAELDKARKLYHDDWVSANLVKIFSDGAGGNPTPIFYDTADYRKLISEVDKRGYQIVTHAIGSEAIHMVVDSYDQLEKENGPKDRRLRMEHVFSVPPPDMPRFAKLAITVGMQPAFCCGNFGGGRSNEFGSVEKAGTLSFSSDWPCSWPPDPLAGIQQAVMREVRRPVTMHGPTLGTPEYSLPDERITVEQAVTAYTKTGAYANFSEKRTGTLEVGKFADLAVLSQDIFTAPHETIGATHVVMTMVGGKVVFTDGQATPVALAKSIH
jgi:predicted amidohydrolase YtcJ